MFIILVFFYHTTGFSAVLLCQWIPDVLSFDKIQIRCVFCLCLHYNALYGHLIRDLKNDTIMVYFYNYKYLHYVLLSGTWTLAAEYMYCCLTHIWVQKELTSGVSTAIDYSDSSMLEARSSLGTIITFFNDAQAYMKGQLQCSPVQEAFLWER